MPVLLQSLLSEVISRFKYLKNHINMAYIILQVSLNEKILQNTFPSLFSFSIGLI